MPSPVSVGGILSHDPGPEGSGGGGGNLFYDSLEQQTPPSTSVK